MSLHSIKLAYRPLRIGMLVQADSSADLTRAIEINTTLAGGIFNPIISVGDNPEEAGCLLELFRLDMLYPVSTTPEIIATFRSDHYPWKEWYTPAALNISPGSDFHRPYVLDVFPAMTAIYQLQHRGEYRKDICVLPTWSRRAKRNLMYLAQYGRYPTERPHYERSFRNGLEATTLKLGRPLSAASEHKLSPIYVTRHGLENLIYFRNSSPGLFVGDPQSVRDVTDFWNIRAAGIDLRFSDPGQLESDKIAVGWYVSWAQESERARGRLEGSCAIWYCGDRQRWAELHELYQSTFPEVRFVGHHVDPVIFNGLNVTPHQYQYPSQTEIAERIESERGVLQYRVLLPSSPSLEEELNAMPQRLAVDVYPPAEGPLDSHTSMPPIVDTIANLATRHSLASCSSVHMDGPSFSLSASAGRHELWWEALPVHEYVHEVLKYLGYAPVERKAGQLARRLVDHLGGYPGVGILQQAATRELISDAANDYGIPFSKAKEKFLKRLGNDDSQMGAKILDTLIEDGLLQLGSTVTCRRCKLKGWLGFSEFRPHVECTHCGHRQRLLQQRQFKEGWSIRTIGTLAPSFAGEGQQGVIPIALSMLLFSCLAKRSGALLWAPCVELKGIGNPIEIDFCAYIRGGMEVSNPVGKCTLLVGECKQKRKITANEFRRTRDFRSSALSRGLDCVPVFSVLRSRFSSSEVSELARFEDDGIPFIVLTGQDLERGEMRLTDDQQSRTAYSLSDFIAASSWRLNQWKMTNANREQ
ncbi:MAG: hypothetical protein H6841_02420 [Planctomycetes bacterium]|nr:hypothetical protein [Planctomycetota bacterium]